VSRSFARGEIGAVDRAGDWYRGRLEHDQVGVQVLDVKIAELPTTTGLVSALCFGSPLLIITGAAQWGSDPCRLNGDPTSRPASILALVDFIASLALVVEIGHRAAASSRVRL
jgi:hypothetical protein